VLLMVGAWVVDSNVADSTTVKQSEISHRMQLNTSSSAVAKRPRDASCLSVVSISSTKRRAESFIVSYAGYRFITAYN